MSFFHTIVWNAQVFQKIENMNEYFHTGYNPSPVSSCNFNIVQWIVLPPTTELSYIYLFMNNTSIIQ